MAKNENLSGFVYNLVEIVDKAESYPQKCCVIMLSCFRAENGALRLGENGYDGKTDEKFQNIRI